MVIRADSDQVEELFDNLGMPMGERRDGGRAAGEEHRASFIEPYPDWQPDGRRSQFFRGASVTSEPSGEVGHKPLERLSPAIERCSRCNARNLKGAVGAIADPRRPDFLICPACAAKVDPVGASLIQPLGAESPELAELLKPKRRPGRPLGSKSVRRWKAEPFVPKSEQEGR